MEIDAFRKKISLLSGIMLIGGVCTASMIDACLPTGFVIVTALLFVQAAFGILLANLLNLSNSNASNIGMIWRPLDRFGILITLAIIGALLTTSIRCLIMYSSSPYLPIMLYLATFSIYHLGEYVFVLYCHPKELSWHSIISIKARFFDLPLKRVFHGNGICIY